MRGRRSSGTHIPLTEPKTAKLGRGCGTCGAKRWERCRKMGPTAEGRAVCYLQGFHSGR